MLVENHLFVRFHQIILVHFCEIVFSAVQQLLGMQDAKYAKGEVCKCQLFCCNQRSLLCDVQ